MIEKRYFGYYVNCDGCPEFYTYDVADDFQGAIDAVKSYGWKLRKDEHGNWDHYCPVCAMKRMM